MKGNLNKLSVENLADILNKFPQPVVIRDDKKFFVFINESAQTAFSINNGEALGKHIQDISQERVYFQRAFEQELVNGASARIQMPDRGNERVFIASEFELTILGLKVYVRLFRETTREEELSRVKTELLSVTAHQLRMPITEVKWGLESLVSSDRLSSEQKNIIESINKKMDEMEQLVSDLLDVTRIEERRFGYRFAKEENIVLFVRNLAEKFKPKILAKGLAFSFNEPKEKPPALVIDESRLVLAVENVINNAINYTLKGKIDISVVHDGKTVSIVVKDTGIGIPESDKKRLFSEFFRAKNAIDHNIEGTGLGLFIVYNIMKRHGGSVKIESKEGDGTKVTLSLPIDPDKIPKGEVPISEAVI